MPSLNGTSKIAYPTGDATIIHIHILILKDELYHEKQRTQIFFGA